MTTPKKGCLTKKSEAAPKIYPRHSIKKLSNISGKHLVAYVIWMQEKGLSAITIKGKGGKIRTVPINQQIVSALEKCLDATPTGSKLLVPVEENMDADFLLTNGNRIMIKRKLFEKFLDSSSVI